MKVVSDGYSFDFADALEAFKFDETDKSQPTYHGQPMKAVDVVAEFEDRYVYVEVKDFHDAGARYSESGEMDHFTWLKNHLKYKYRDSYLYRHAEGKADKPIHYICLLQFSNSKNFAMRKALRRELPVGKASDRWEREIVSSCQVVNLDQWNKAFPSWPACKLP